MAHRDCGSPSASPSVFPGSHYRASCGNSPEFMLVWLMRNSSIPRGGGGEQRLLSPGRGTFHVLRDVERVCETVLNPMYTRASYVGRHELSGLPSSSGSFIRNRFMGKRYDGANGTIDHACFGESMRRCHRALGSTPLRSSGTSGANGSTKAGGFVAAHVQRKRNTTSNCRVRIKQSDI